MVKCRMKKYSILYHKVRNQLSMHIFLVCATENMKIPKTCYFGFFFKKMASSVKNLDSF